MASKEPVKPRSLVLEAGLDKLQAFLLEMSPGDELSVDRAVEISALEAEVCTRVLEALTRAAAHDSVTSETLTLYGRALLQSGRSDLAEVILREATKRYPVEPAAFKPEPDLRGECRNLAELRLKLGTRF